MKKAIIFDLDGVLLSTDHFHYLAWKKIADKENIYFDETINNRLRGVSRMASLDIILERAARTYSEEEKLLLTEEKNNCYRELLNELDPSFLAPNTTALLGELRERGVRLAIGSSSKNTRFILEKVELTDFFEVISDGTMIQHSKPDPEVFLLAASLLELSPEDCYVVEDAFAGIDAAKAGGFTAIGIGDAFRYEKTDYQIEKLADILTL